MQATLREIGEAEDAAEQRDAVVAAVQAGNSLDAVALVIQLQEETIRAWVREEEERILRQRVSENRMPAQ